MINTTEKAMETWSSEKGFTLVELSIVLVIIGLLLGGVLKGQEMIESARMKSVMAAVDSYRAAVNTFQDKYKALPGDYNLAATNLPQLGGTTATNGNGNGSINAAAAPRANGNVAENAGENLQFWFHLGASNLITGIQNATAVYGQGLPEARIGGGFQLTEANVAGKVGQWFRLQFGTAAPAASVSGSQAFQIDSKVDDGIPSTGSVRVDTNTAAIAPATCQATNAYTASNTNRTCVLFFEM